MCLPDPRPHRRHSHTRRQHQPLLGRRHRQVHVPRLERQRVSRHAGDAVHDEQRACFAHDLANRGDVVQDAGGRLAVCGEHDPQTWIVPKRFGHDLRVHRLTPGKLMFNHLNPVSPAEVRPARAELSRLHHQGPVPRAEGIGDRGLHHARTRAGQQEHVIRRGKNLLKPLDRISKQRGKFRPAVVDRSSGHRGLDPFRNGCRAGRKKPLPPRPVRRAAVFDTRGAILQ